MGQSTDAILYYGIELGSLDEHFNAPEDEYGESSWSEVFEKLITKESGLSYGTHCSGDYPMYYISARGCYFRAWRGSPKDISELPTPSVELQHRLALFATRFASAVGVADDSNFKLSWRLAR